MLGVELPRRVRNWALAAIFGVASALLVVLPMTDASAAIDPCGAQGNKIACENSKPGTDPSVWDIEGSGDAGIQGFATDISVNVGSRIDFKIDTDASNYAITIYRLGYYGGLGARQIASVTPSASLPQHQPQCITDVQTELYDCGNWGISAAWNVPSTAVSGVYIANLKVPSNGDQSHITFVVRDDASHSDIVMQTSDPTWQAYNTYGGSDFYQGAANGRAYKISYNRPVLTRDGIGGRDFFFSNEYPLVRFMERNGYDVSYQAGVDTDRRGNLLTNHKAFVSVGHDEYWSGAQRANVEAARDAGVNLMFLSGNEVYWKTRYEPSADSSHTAYRTLVSYKETWSNDKIDPSDEWTGTWRDPRFAPRSKGGGKPENALTGTMYQANYTDLSIKVPAAQGKNRLWRNTTVATQTAGQTATLAPHTVGYESDEDIDNGFRPAGLVRMSTTTGPTPEYLVDYGNTVVAGTTTHAMTMYRAASGALVFSAGTVQWTWGLDAEHDSAFAAEPADARMQQAQVNLLADMGAQPVNLMAGLVVATKSTDTTGPTVTITSPAAGASQANGASVTVTGTAADTGGVVAGVEASTDGGNTWHPATGTTSWSYNYIQKGVGSTPIQVRAIDDSANKGAAVTRSFTVACPCSVFGSVVPAKPAANDSSAVELGLRFTPMGDGFVSGVRFYKGTGNSGTHVGSLWTASGTRLATVNFTGESATGWQNATFATPVAVTAGTTYVVSYTAPNGHYANLENAFTMNPFEAPPLLVDGGFGAPAAGVYGNSGTFPALSFGNANYYVDVAYTTSDASPLIATNQWPVAGTSSVPMTTTVSAKFSKPLVAGSQGLTLKDANGVTVAGSIAYDTSTRVITFTPSTPLNGFVNYTATLSGTDTQGNQVTTGKTWSFRTAKPANAPGVCPCSIFDDGVVPTQLEDADTVPVTLGVRFTSDVDGTVTGVRFYKGPNNTGTHTGTLWTATGTQLATGTFTNESTTGWQDLTFATPVTITKNSTYVASYRTTVGRYSATPGAFTAGPVTRAPLSGIGGSYTYSTGFPSSTSSASYLVDVVFLKAAPSISVVSQDPANGSVQVPRGTTIKTTFSAPIQATGWTQTVTSGPTSSPVAGTSALNADRTVLTFTPSALLPADGDVKSVLSGVTSSEGATLATQTWTFHTKAADSSASQSLFSDQVPSVVSSDDGAAVELGTAFEPAAAGTITAVRFYKGTGNDGTHTGSIWSTDGTRLATVTFTGETASGWQTANLATPLPVTADTTYIVSYYAPQGHYSATSGFFNSAWAAGDLSARATNNGLYLYGTGGGFPVYSWGATNYFVDVVYSRSGPAISVAGRTPGPGATGVSRSTTIAEAFTAAINPSGWSMSVKQGTTTIPGTAALSADQKTLTFTPTSSLPADADITTTVSGVFSTEGMALPTDVWTFHTAPAALTQVSMFSTQTPTTAATADTAAVELGVAFTPSVNGSVTGIKFYKGTGNSGTHTGSIWDSSGVRLGTVTFTGESTTGWQTATFTTPIPLTAGQTYIASYYAPKGRYSSTSGFFGSAWTSGVLTARASTNGLYKYGTGGGLPTSSWNATNYFVDVIFSY